MSSEQILSDALLDRIITVGNSIDEADIALETSYANAQKWEGMREEYNRLDQVLSEKRADLAKWEQALDDEPNMVDIRTKLAQYRDKAQVVDENDPIHAGIISLDNAINDIIADGKRPYVKAIDAALNEKRAYLRFMAEPENSQYKKDWDRMKKDQESK